MAHCGTCSSNVDLTEIHNEGEGVDVIICDECIKDLIEDFGLDSLAGRRPG